jgi:hypothetical protein
MWRRLRVVIMSALVRGAIFWRVRVVVLDRSHCGRY